VPDTPHHAKLQGSDEPVRERRMRGGALHVGKSPAGPGICAGRGPGFLRRRGGSSGAYAGTSGDAADAAVRS
jgi:hypothetical protein